MKKVLEIGTPLITSYTDIAATMAILATDTKYETWIYNNFNNIVYLCNTYAGTFYDQYYPQRGYVFEQVPFLECNKIKKDFMNLFCRDFTDLIIKCIDDNNYVYTMLNNFYIPVSGSYNNTHINHDTFIYGYNTENQEVYIADFYNGNKYGFYKISFDAINNAYQKMEMIDERESYIYVIKIKESYDYDNLDVNVKFIKQGLKDFINSREDIRIHLEKTHWERHVLNFGISYFDNIINSFQIGTDSLTSLYVFYDFSISLKKKLEFLHKKGVVSNYYELHDFITNINHKCLILVNLYLKQRFKKNIIQEIKNILIEKIENIKNLYNEFISNFICDLREVVIVDNVPNNLFESKSDSVSLAPYTSTWKYKYTWKYLENLTKEYTDIVNIEFDFIQFVLKTDATIGFTAKDEEPINLSFMPVVLRVNDKNELFFEVSDETWYSHDNKFQCKLNEKYHVNVVVDLNKQTYSVFVTHNNIKRQIAMDYKYQKNAPATTNIGRIFFSAYSLNDYKIENLIINGDDNTGDISIKLENGSTTRNLDFNSSNISVELFLWNTDSKNINTIQLANEFENAVTVIFKNHEININNNKIEKEIPTNCWNKFVIILDNDNYDIFVNDECIAKSLPSIEIKPVDRVNIDTTGVLFIKELRVFK